MQPSFKIIHPQFKLNGISFTREDLKEVGYCLIKEGHPFEVSTGNFLIDWVDNSDIILVKTSGSTGAPKLIKLQKQQMVNSALATGAFFELKAGSKALLCLPTDFIAGKMMLVRAMVLGWHLDDVAPNSNPLENITTAYNFGAMIPMQLANSLEKINLIKTLIVGGAKMSSDLMAKVQDKSTAVFETYGMTETITHIAAKAVNHQQKGIETNFKALPNVSFKIDKRDCLMIKATDISNTEVVTNDIVSLHSDTEFEWLGRYDTVINSGGIKLIPEKIEAKLTSIIKERFFVAGIPDEKLGEKLVLVVEGKSRVINLKVLDLTVFELPKEVYFVDDFIETETKKIQRKKTLDLI